MRLWPATAHDVASVALRMRDRDVAEMSAMSWADSREELAATLSATYGGRHDTSAIGRTVGVPIAICALAQHRPGVATLAMFATDDFPNIAIPLTRFIVKTLFPSVREAGAHRIECVTDARYTEMHRWLDLIGLRRRADLEAYGRNRERFIEYAWVEGET